MYIYPNLAWTICAANGLVAIQVVADKLLDLRL